MCPEFLVITVENPADKVRTVAGTAVGKDGVSTGHLLGGCFPGTKVGGRLVWDLHGKGLVGHRANVLHACIISDADRRGIARVHERLPCADTREVVSVRVPWIPVVGGMLDLSRLDPRVVNGGFRAHSPVEGGQIDERLEYGPYLTSGMKGPVEL